LREPGGDEMSAFGVAFDAGGVCLTQVPENSEAAKLGFRTGDLIQEINGEKIKTIKNLIDYLQLNGLNSKHKIQIIRNQNTNNLVINCALTRVTTIK